MTILQSAIAQAAGGSYQIERSLRFNSADSAYLNRTPASAGNRRTWTWSGWVKRSKFGEDEVMFSAGTSDPVTVIRFSGEGSASPDGIRVFHYAGAFQFDLTTTAQFRDPSAWYHIVVACDTPQATSSNRLKIYVNGVQVTTFDTATYPSQNYDTSISNNVVHNLGRAGSGSNYFNGYITDTYFIDGQALDPTSFGETDTNTGVWNPKTYSGTYGTNGFNLKFADNSNTTAATLGKDSSSNANNWTPNNFSVTAGVGNDSLVDTPTNYGTDTGVGGEVRGNYCTLNPLDKGSDVNAVLNGNLDATWTSNNGHSIRSTLAVSSGKWYWEFTNVNNLSCGIIKSELKIVPSSGSLWPGSDGFGSGGSFAYRPDNGNKTTNSTGTSYGATFTTTDVIGCALDMDNGKIYWSKNGTWQASGDPAAGTNAAYTGISGTFSPAWGYIGAGNNTLTANFGQRPFAYTAPSGFKALCSQNFATPTVGATSSTLANDYFDVSLWTGNAVSGRAIVTDSGFAPDWVWAKARNGAPYHTLNDIVRGTNNILQSNTTSAEQVGSNGYVTAFNANGFSISSGSDINGSGDTFVGWLWKGGGTAVSNTSGTITSSVSASTTSGFSVVTYTGNATSGATFGHGLGAVPKMIIFKCRNFAYQWLTYHVALGNEAFLTLDSTSAPTTGRADFLNSTTPSSSLITLGNTAGINENTRPYVAYCFAEVTGFSKFGTYVGNGSTDGPFIYCGFRPRYIMVKRTDSTGDWKIWDAARVAYNVDNLVLWANLANAEGNQGSQGVDLLSNGVKIRSSDTIENASNGAYIFMAFAESPFNYSRAR